MKIEITKATSRRKIKMVKALEKKFIDTWRELRANVRGRGIINEHMRDAPSDRHGLF